MIIFDYKVRLTITSRIADKWQKSVKMYNEEISEIDTLKYLGVEIDKKLSGKKHINERTRMTMASMVKLEKIGINSYCPNDCITKSMATPDITSLF